MGARGTTAYFFKRLEVSDPRPSAERDEEGKTRHIPLLRAFTLFHASQIEDIPGFTPPTAAEAPWRASDAADTIVGQQLAQIEGVGQVRIGGEQKPSETPFDIPYRGYLLTAVFAAAGDFPCL